MAIPGDVHDTLISQSVIPDPYYGMNELDTLFVGRGDWSIERKFNWKKSEEKTFLRLEKVLSLISIFFPPLSETEEIPQYHTMSFCQTCHPPVPAPNTDHGDTYMRLLLPKLIHPYFQSQGRSLSFPGLP